MFGVKIKETVFYKKIRKHLDIHENDKPQVFVSLNLIKMM